MNSTIKKTLKLTTYAILVIGLALLINIIKDSSLQQSQDLETAIEKKQPLSCGDTLRDVQHVYVEDYKVGSNIIDLRTNKIWSRNNCKSYYPQS